MILVEHRLGRCHNSNKTPLKPSTGLSLKGQ
jgi:hypothetical protein